MNKEDLINYLDKEIRLVCVFGSGEPIFYSGRIISANSETVLFLDKFSNEILLSIDTIKKVEAHGN